MPFMFDPVYWMFLLPALALAGIATALTKSTFAKYSRVPGRMGFTGAEAAERMLRDSGVDNVRIESVRGFLSDHYDPTRRVLRLSPDVYASRSLAAIGVACHEAGHAIQHARHFAPLMLRSALVPAAQLGSNLSYWLIFAGLIFGFPGLMKIGIVIFTAAVAFSIVTLPVEWDASARAKRRMVECGIVSSAESEGAGRVLNAAFLTYLAAAITSLLTLLYYLMLGRDRD